MLLHGRRKRGIAAVALLSITIFAVISSTRHSGVPPWRRMYRYTGGHPYVKPSSLPIAPPAPTITDENRDATRTPPQPSLLPGSSTSNRDRVLVVAKIEGEDVSWLSKSFPTWQTTKYTIPTSFAHLYPGAATVDKGRIANAYLSYLIENYYALPSTMVFITPHRNRLHAQSSSQHQAFLSLGRYPLLATLNEHHVQNSGYRNLRCVTPSTCLTTNFSLDDPLIKHRTLEVSMPKAWTQLFPNTTVPDTVAAPCCAEFAVSRTQVRQRGIEDYKRFWTWLQTTNMDDETAGSVFEALWHVIFGREHLDCGVDAGRCECDVYGRC